MEKKDEFILFFKIVLGKIVGVARNLINSVLQTVSMRVRWKVGEADVKGKEMLALTVVVPGSNPAFLNCGPEKVWGSLCCLTLYKS